MEKNAHERLEHLLVDALSPDDLDRWVDAVAGTGVARRHLEPGSHEHRVHVAVQHLERRLPLDRQAILRLIEFVGGREKELRALAAVFPDGAPRGLQSNSNLPQRPSIIGRGHQLRQIRNTLRPTQRGFLLQVIGPPGIGKTTLAIEAAWDALDEGSFDEARFVSVPQTGGFSLQALIAQLVPPEAGMGTPDEYLRSRRVLVVIDNFETIGAEREAVCQFLNTDLPPPSKAIITSRALENIAAAFISLARLDETESEVLLRAYLERCDPKPNVSPHALRRVADLAGGNPQFLLLASSHLATGASLQTIERMFDDPRLAEYEPYVELWKGLSEVEKKALMAAQLSAGRAPIGLLRSITLLSESGLDAILVNLTRRIVLFTPNWSSGLPQDSPCQEIHPLTSTFIRTRTEGPEAPDRALMDTVRRGFTQYYIEFAIAHGGRAWWGSRQIEVDLNNVLRALAILVDQQDWKAVLELSRACRHLVVRQDRMTPASRAHLSEYYTNSERVCREGIEAAVRSSSVQDECDLLVELGHILVLKRDLEGASEVLSRALERSGTSGYTRKRVMALRRLAHIADINAQPDEAALLYRKSIEEAERSGDQVGVHRGYRGLGDLAMKSGLADHAASLYRRAVPLTLKDDLGGAARVYRRLSVLAYRAGKFKEGLRDLEQAIQAYVEGRDFGGTCYSLYAAGWFANRLGATDATRLAWETSCVLLAEVHDDVFARLEGGPVEAGHLLQPDPLELFVPKVDQLLELTVRVLVASTPGGWTPASTKRLREHHQGVCSGAGGWAQGVTAVLPSFLVSTGVRGSGTPIAPARPA